MSNQQMTSEDRWVPIAESGHRWAPRSQAEAEDCLLNCPAGSTYSNGADIDGVTHVIHERRYVSEWREVT